MFYYISAADAHQATKVTADHPNSGAFFENIIEGVLEGVYEISFSYASFFAGRDYVDEPSLLAKINEENTKYGTAVQFLIDSGYEVEGRLEPIIHDGKEIGKDAYVDISWKNAGE